MLPVAMSWDCRLPRFRSECSVGWCIYLGMTRCVVQVAKAASLRQPGGAPWCRRRITPRLRPSTTEAVRPPPSVRHGGQEQKADGANLRDAVED